MTRLVAPAGLNVFTSDFLIAGSGAPDVQNWAARQVPVGDLPPEALSFLLGSRYCETDVMSELAWSLFGGVPAGWARVRAIVDYVHNRIEFGYQHARSTRTAWEGDEERVGVCQLPHLHCLRSQRRYWECRIPASWQQSPPTVSFRL